MRTSRTVRAILVVAGLGLGAGAGAVLGLWAGITWWLAREGPARPGAHLSLLPAAGSGLVGAVAGLAVGVLLAAGVLVVAGVLDVRPPGRRRPAGERRRPGAGRRRPVGEQAGTEPGPGAVDTTPGG